MSIFFVFFINLITKEPSITVSAEETERGIVENCVFVEQPPPVLVLSKEIQVGVMENFLTICGRLPSSEKAVRRSSSLEKCVGRKDQGSLLKLYKLTKLMICCGLIGWRAMG